MSPRITLGIGSGQNERFPPAFPISFFSAYVWMQRLFTVTEEAWLQGQFSLHFEWYSQLKNLLLHSDTLKQN